MNQTVQPAKKLSGTIQVDPDKSISHRAALVASLAEGATQIRSCLMADDVRCTLRAISAMGVEVRQENAGTVQVMGKGLFGLEAPAGPIQLGNSGTSMRLLLGLLAGQHFSCELHGDNSLSRRPMDRVIDPLKNMGATVMGIKDPRQPPVFIQGARLKPIQYELLVASAQVKSAILLAGLYPDGITCVREPIQTRDHTERMLRLFGADIKREGQKISVRGPASLKAQTVEVMGDPSSAAFFIAAALVVPGSRVTIEHVNLNPTRIGFLKVLERMGATLSIEIKGERSGEPYGTLSAETSDLKGIRIEPHEVPWVIDELPILMTVAVFAKGSTHVKGAQELRVKETDRIHSMAAGLKKMGIRVEELEDGLTIKGGALPTGALVDCYGDHRTAMSFAIAALGASDPVTISGVECINTSFPSFWSVLHGLRNRA